MDQDKENLKTTEPSSLVIQKIEMAITTVFHFCWWVNWYREMRWPVQGHVMAQVLRSLVLIPSKLFYNSLQTSTVTEWNAGSLWHCLNSSLQFFRAFRRIAPAIDTLNIIRILLESWAFGKDLQEPETGLMSKWVMGLGRWRRDRDLEILYSSCDLYWCLESHSSCPAHCFFSWQNKPEFWAV